MRNFSPVWDIYTLKRSFHSILHAERSAYVFHRRNKAQTNANRKHSTILSKIKLHFSPVWGISTLIRSFHSSLHAELTAYAFQRRNKPRQTQTTIVRRFCRKLCVISNPFQIFRRLNAHFTPFYMQNVVHACTEASKQAQTQANRNNFSILSKIKRYISPVWDISAFQSSFHSILRAELIARLFCSVETSPETRKQQSSVDLVEN